MNDYKPIFKRSCLSMKKHKKRESIFLSVCFFAGVFGAAYTWLVILGGMGWQ